MGLKSGWNTITFEPVEYEFSSCWDDYAVKLNLNGQPYGNIVDDNTWTPSYYRYHDLLHIGFYTLWGESPVTKKLAHTHGDDCLIKEYMCPTQKMQCGHEEAFAAYLFEIFYECRWDKTSILWGGIEMMTKSWCSITKDQLFYYCEVIFPIYDKLVENHGGVIKFNQKTNSIKYDPIAVDIQSFNSKPFNKPKYIPDAWPLKL